MSDNSSFAVALLGAQYARQAGAPVLAAAVTTFRTAIEADFALCAAVKKYGGTLGPTETVDGVLSAENEVYRKSGAFPYPLDDRITLSLSLPPGTLAAGR